MVFIKKDKKGKCRKENKKNPAKIEDDEVYCALAMFADIKILKESIKCCDIDSEVLTMVTLCKEELFQVINSKLKKNSSDKLGGSTAVGDSLADRRA